MAAAPGGPACHGRVMRLTARVKFNRSASTAGGLHVASATATTSNKLAGHAGGRLMTDRDRYSG